jgi:hypothetical protein
MRLNSGDTITVKIGIHKGKVIPAVVGDHKPQFSLIGDAVNTTSRMSSNGEKNCITCSEFAYEEIKTKYKNFNVNKKQIKGKGLMNLYTYDINKNKKQNLKNLKGSIFQNLSGDLIVKSSTKNVNVFVKHDIEQLLRKKKSVIKSIMVQIAPRESILSNIDSVDDMLIVENCQDLSVKNGKGNQQDNIFSDLNRFNNDANEYNYNDVGYGKKEPKFEIIKNTFFSDSYCFYKFKNEVSKNGFRIFENLIINQSKERSIVINITFFIILLFSVYVTSHYSMEGSDYLPYLEIKTTFMLLLLFLFF